MANNRYFIFLIFTLLSFPYYGHSQVFIPITQTSGTQVFSGQEVTITSAGSASSNGTHRDCEATPFWIGANYNGIPGSYSFSFSFPVNQLRFKMTATGIGEVNSFYINGVHYPLTAANFDSLKTCDTQYFHQLTPDANGNAVYIGPVVPNTSYYGKFGSGTVTIQYPGNIDSVRIHNNGIEGGTTFGFAFYGFYAAAYNDSACYGDTLRLFAQPDISGPPTPVFSWTGPNGFTSNEQNPTIPNSSSVHEGEYIVNIKYGVNEATDTTIVKLRPVPSTPTITTINPACQGSTVRLGGSSADPGVDFMWSGPGNYNSRQKDESIRNFQERDTGDYYLTTILNGCPSPSAKIKMEIAYPTKGDTVVSSICRGGSYDFFGQKLSQEGIYQHLLANGNSMGCDSTTFLQLVFEPIQPDTLYEAICQGSSYFFNGREIKTNGIYSDTFNATDGCDSVMVLFLTVNDVIKDTIYEEVCPGESYFFNGREITTTGIYNDTLKTNEGCDSISQLHLNRRTPPTLSADYGINQDFCLGDSVLIVAKGAEKYMWQVNDMAFGEGDQKLIQLDNPENHIVINGTDHFGCSETLAIDILSNPCCELFIPNAFSPNGDGKNDVFRIYSLGNLQSYSINIFNRWGEVVFKVQDINKSWDGTLNGKALDAGTYFFIVKATCLSGTEIQKSGDLTLIR